MRAAAREVRTEDAEELEDDKVAPRRYALAVPVAVPAPDGDGLAPEYDVEGEEEETPVAAGRRLAEADEEERREEGVTAGRDANASEPALGLHIAAGGDGDQVRLRVATAPGQSIPRGISISISISISIPKRVHSWQAAKDVG